MVDMYRWVTTHTWSLRRAPNLFSASFNSSLDLTLGSLTLASAATMMVTTMRSDMPPLYLHMYKCDGSIGHFVISGICAASQVHVRPTSLSALNTNHHSKSLYWKRPWVIGGRKHKQSSVPPSTNTTQGICENLSGAPRRRH